MPLLGELSALLTACLWSGSAMAFAAATRIAGSFAVNVARLLLAATYLVVMILLLQLDVNLLPGQILYLSISGIIGLTLGDTFLFRAYQEIGARITMLIMSLAPAFAALLAYVALDESISLRGLGGIIITIAGISVVVLERSSSVDRAVPVTGGGLAFALLAAIGQGAGLVFAKMAFREGAVNGFVATAVRIVASLAVLLPVALMTRRFRSPVRLFREQREAFWLTALGSILGPFFGISFSLIAVEHTSVGIAATIMALVPVLMLPLVRLIYKEQLSWRAILGASVAVGGVAVLFLR
jgi:drug/metabolite transporter (DMT)-like permease